MEQKKERFYGENGATMQATSPLYAGIDTPIRLYDALCGLWSAATCAPRLRADWSEANRTLGQCSITSFLVQDIFGGEVYGVPLEGGGGYHCFNVVAGHAFDLTDAQFGGKPLVYGLDYPQSREAHLSDPDKMARYRLLCDALRRHCNG